MDRQAAGAMLERMPRPSDGFVLYYPSRRQNPAALRCLAKFLPKTCAESGPAYRRLPSHSYSTPESIIDPSICRRMPRATSSCGRSVGRRWTACLPALLDGGMGVSPRLPTAKGRAGRHSNPPSLQRALGVMECVYVILHASSQRDSNACSVVTARRATISVKLISAANAAPLASG